MRYGSASGHRSRRHPCNLCPRRSPPAAGGPIRGILFAKDGTLLDFCATWISADLAGGVDAQMLLADVGYDAATGGRDPHSMLAAGTDADRFWNPVPRSRPKRAARPVFALPPSDQLELWPEQSLETFIQRNVESAARRAAEEERRGEAETPRLGRMERKRICG